MEEHVSKDSIVSPSDIRAGEKILNNTSKAWIRMFNIGEGQGHGWRVNRALLSNYAPIPPLAGLRKDHKPLINGEPDLGPKLRPLCPANHAPNAPLSNIISRVCKGLADEMLERHGTEVVSTEELMYNISEANSKR